MNCLFCGKQEKNYIPDRHVDFICGGCVLLLADASQKDLKKAHTLAIEKGYLNKANSIESFLMPEGKHANRPTKSIERNLNRERTARPVRNKKRLPEQITA